MDEVACVQVQASGCAVLGKTKERGEEEKKMGKAEARVCKESWERERDDDSI